VRCASSWMKATSLANAGEATSAIVARMYCERGRCRFHAKAEARDAIGPTTPARRPEEACSGAVVGRSHSAGCGRLCSGVRHEEPGLPTRTPRRFGVVDAAYPPPA